MEIVPFFSAVSVVPVGRLSSLPKAAVSPAEAGPRFFTSEPETWNTPEMRSSPATLYTEAPSANCPASTRASESLPACEV